MSLQPDKFTRKWITDNALDICARYEHGVLTLRALHYQLVGIGMFNTVQHYKRVVAAMIEARRKGIVAYEQFSDHEREMLGLTSARKTNLDDKISYAKTQVEAWMTSYSKNRWENQPDYIEVWIEKKALQGVFRPVCMEKEVALCPCKGYPSLTFLNDAAARFKAAEGRGQNPTIIYFGDHDPSGEDIPRSLNDNFIQDFGVMVTVDVRALNKSQCLELKLPAAPAKSTDSRTANFDGLGQIELDAVQPELLATWTEGAIDDYFDPDRGEALDEIEDEERVIFQRRLKDHVAGL